LETGGTESGTIRKFVWQAAIDGWKATPKNMSIGTGTETFAFAFYQYKPIGHNLTSEWDFLYNKAHNEYLNYLTTTGLFGLGSYMLLLIGMGIVFVQSILRNPTSVENGLAKSPQMPVHSDSSEFDRCASQLFVPALFAGWVSILITNFFGFSVVVVQLYLFLFPALAFILMQKNRQTKTIHIPSIAATSLVVITACLFVFVIYRIGLAWVADRTFAVGYRLNRVGSPAKAYPYMTQAIAMIPDEPLYRDERASLLSTLSLSAIDSGQATLAAQLAEQAVTDNQTSLMISPNNVNYWKTRTKVLYAMTPLDPAYLESAITSLEHAASLSPNDPKIAYNLGVLAARAGKSQEAETYLLRAKELKPNYRDVYKGLYLLYTQLKNIAKARDVLTWYLNSVDSNDVEFPGLLKNLK
jgi:tetratricopeptide (TPR) repeat protein